MSTTEHDELALKTRLRQSEQQLDQATVNRLSKVRATALEQESLWFGWFAEYRNMFSATLVAASIAAVVILPTGTGLLAGNGDITNSDHTVTLLMEELEFYLWLNESGMLVAER